MNRRLVGCNDVERPGDCDLFQIRFQHYCLVRHARSKDSLRSRRAATCHEQVTPVTCHVTCHEQVTPQQPPQLPSPTEIIPDRDH